MTEVEAANYTVFPDTHGQYELVARAIEAEDSSGAERFVFVGDVVDGPDTRRLIQLIKDLGRRAVSIVGNHEWVLRNALFNATEPEDIEAVNLWRTELWPSSRYERDMLANYGLKRTRDWAGNAKNLRAAMEAVGHLEWLDNLSPYFSTPNFVAVHAGPSRDQSWTEQQAYLTVVADPKHRSSDEPPQIFDHDFAQPIDLPGHVDSSIFVSGHTHLSLPPEKRVAIGRVCLASPLGRGAPLFVWRSAENRIVSYDQD